VTVCHLPPGTSKWNKIEHRLFSQISLAWRDRPLVSHEVVVSTIAAVTTRTGLTVNAELDTGEYPKGIKITAKQIKDLEKAGILQRHNFHGEWNYTVKPGTQLRVLFLDARLRRAVTAVTPRLPLLTCVNAASSYR
jgi:Rhodopirellula transposase DDE domain